MFRNKTTNKRIAIVASLITMPLIAACDGGGDDESSSTVDRTSASSNSSSGSGAGLICVALILTSGDDACLEAAVSGSSGGSGSAGDTGGGGESQALDPSVQYVVNAEVEPNDDRSLANPLNILTTPSPDGFFAEGAVNDASDLADTYTFARPSSRHFRMVLCSDGSPFCNSFGEVDTVTLYIDVLDSTGNLIASSFGLERNRVEPMIHAGAPYFVRVVAGDTMGATVPYQLIAHEFE